MFEYWLLKKLEVQCVHNLFIYCYITRRRIFNIQKVYKWHTYTSHLHFFYKNIEPFVCNRYFEKNEYLWAILYDNIANSYSWVVTLTSFATCLSERTPIQYGAYYVPWSCLFPQTRSLHSHCLAYAVDYKTYIGSTNNFQKPIHRPQE